ncbi:hypothetical protein EDD86DRAFT_276226 [Gorgonomyces haynaldii]|nr:hypothetical protein EDD86DRAFT_276226 [Gorgonomyces haynaldii]
MFLVTSVFRLVVLVLTDLAMIPALQIMYSNKRHFELFIGIYFFAAKLLFNLSQALQTPFFLSELQWHFLADVLGMTYATLLIVHLVNHPNENINIVMRYLGFSLTWIAKTFDQWDSVLMQLVVMSGFVVFMLLRFQEIKWNIKNLQLGGCAFGGGLLLFLILEHGFSDQTRSIRIVHALVQGSINLCAGATMFFMWQAVPIRKFKDDDIIPEDSEPEQLPTKAPIKQKHARYMEDLIKNARERKLYQERLHERRIQKEKEELGIHNDKEEFVTSAYLEKQQELERLEREEEERDQKRGQGLQSFYRDLIESRTQVVEDVPIIPQEAPKKHQIVDHVARNDNQEIIDKRQLLQGGLNIVKEKPKIERSNRIHESTVHPVTNSQKIQEKPKTNPIQDSHMDSKRKQEPEDQEQKAQKIDKVQSARERYLARKAANT